MKKEPQWLVLPAVLVIHQSMLFEFGGDEGVRDQDVLEFALSRPRHP